MKRSHFLIFSLVFFLLCEFTGSMYKPGDPSYEPPSFTIDTTASNVADGDTVSADTVRLTLNGNDEEYRNRFRYQLDDGEWTDWEGDREPVYEIKLDDLPGGTHTFTIEVCYHPSEEKTDSTVTFFRAVRPFITDTADTVLAVDAEAPCTLTVKAEGSGDLDYAWYHDSTLLDSATSDTLVLEAVTLADTGRYYCLVTNNNWGEATGPAICLRVLFRVFYDGNGNTGGVVPVDTNGYEPGTMASPLNNSGNLTRRGYTFAGWNMKADGSGASPEAGLKFEIDTENVTLYAEWEENPSFALTYDGNGATDGDVPDTARQYRTGELIAVAGNSGDLAMAGFTFTGWNTSKDGSGNGYGENDSLEMGDEDVTLYAQWSDNPTFTVTYAENGADSGEVPVDAQKYEEDDSVTVAGNSGQLWRDGNTFTGWNTEAQGDDGKAYTPGATFVMGTKNVTLYARWTTNPVYTVTYLGNGNTVGTVPGAVSGEEDVEITVAGPGTLVKKGHSFTGWNTADDGSGSKYGSNASYTIGDEDDTLYAQWEINRYRVTYDGNGDNVDNLPLQTTHRYNTEMTLDTIVPTRIGYTFFRWNTDVTGDGEDYEPVSEFTVGDDDVTFYARWTVNKYTVTYNGNDNTGGSTPDSTKVDYNDSVTIAGKGNLERTGESFGGWNTKSNGGGTAYPADTTILMGAEDMELFAQWTANSYTVTFDKNDVSATGDMEAQTIVFGQSADLTSNGFSLTGHSFAGWATSSNGEVVYEDEAEYTMDAGDNTLYAVWMINRYLIRFDTQGEGSVDSQYVNYDDTVRTPAASTRAGHVFDGWYEDPDCTTAWEFGTMKITAADTLYAKWLVEYTVTFDGRSATTPPEPVSITVVTGSAVGTFPAAPTKTGCDFAGWYTGIVGNGTAFTASTPVNGDITVYALWMMSDAEGNVYKTVSIGSQVWMAENLRATKYNDGTTEVPNVTDPDDWEALDSPGYCWYGNDSATYHEDYGVLYNWYTLADTNAHRLAPAGWHIPDTTEWNTLEANLGGVNVAGGKLKEAGTAHWSSPNTGATNETGFLALPGGYRINNGTFTLIGNFSVWWSATEDDAYDAWNYYLNTSNAIVARNSTNKRYGFSVRCVRD